MAGDWTTVWEAERDETEVAWTRREKRKKLCGEESEENPGWQEKMRKAEKKIERLHNGSFGSSGSDRGRCCR